MIDLGEETPPPPAPEVPATPAAPPASGTSDVLEISLEPEKN